MLIYIPNNSLGKQEAECQARQKAEPQGEER